VNTIRNRILETLRIEPGSTSWELSKILKENPSSISSILKRMTERGDVSREKGEGPRKGYGYYLL
jgi:DNA-binding MarR family transcriptional regulator